jgi:hypothetical protein
MGDKRDTDRLVVLIVVPFIVAAVAMAVLLLFPPISHSGYLRRRGKAAPLFVSRDDYSRQ